MILNGHHFRAKMQEEAADRRWEEEHGEKIEMLHEIDRMAKAGEITHGQRMDMLEVLFPGFTKL